MRRLSGFLFWVLAGLATPALAEAPESLRFLESRLTYIASSSPGNIGIAALDLRTGEMVAVHGDHPFPMASTVKIAVAANYLAQVEFGRRDLDERIGGRTAAELMDARLQQRQSRYRLRPQPRRPDGSMNGLSRAASRTRSTATSPSFWPPSVTWACATPTPKRWSAVRRCTMDVCASQSRQYLLGLMARCITGKNRMRGMLPPGTRVEHKTGTLANYSSDVGFITLPNGRRLAVAFFARSAPNRPQTIATAARAVFDGFDYHSRLPYTASHTTSYGTP